MSDKKYTSIFGSDKPISAPQYIAELICKKSADIQRINLPNQFWKDRKKWGDWARRYNTEIVGANKLLKFFTPEAIIAALQDPRATRVQSLHNKSLPEIITAKQRHMDAVEANREEFVVEKDTKSLPAKKTNKKSLFNKLREDDEDKN